MLGDDGLFLGRADFAWPEVCLGLELDSWQFHGTPAAFENDRARDVALAEAGWQVLRFTWKRVMSFQTKVIAGCVIDPSDLTRVVSRVWGDGCQPLIVGEPSG
ncbi:MAG: endonuclease domain-containing protein [Myxococcaceae bacterium]|nr:endonuclease domain-containing protein [Myxococcaceae bacterium]